LLTEAARHLLDLLSGRERRRLVWVLLASLIAAGLQALGVASILPFIALVVNSDALTNYPALQVLADTVGAVTWRDTVIWAGLGSAAMVALGNAAKVWSSWLQYRFEARIHHRLAAGLLRGFLLAPYAFHIRRDAPSLMRAINRDVSGVTGGILLPLMSGVSSVIAVVALIALLAAQSPAIAAAAMTTLGGAYFAVFRLARRQQAQLADESRDAEHDGLTTSHEAFGGIKELIVLDRRETVISRFADASKRVATVSVKKRLWQLLPRHLLETITIGGILIVTLVLLGESDTGAASAIPTLALYSFVGYRLLPGFQQIYSTAVSVRYGRPALTALHADWFGTGAGARPPVLVEQIANLTLCRQISLNGVTFTYPGASRPALSSITLDVRRGESIGLIGRTGAGKSTLADILLGLFEPDTGSMTVDGVPLSPGSMSAWRRQVGYVAQHIFLANVSVSENIAFGLPPARIDHAAVEEAARLAQIDEFIQNLPRGYDTVVGERGVRLSGGERQRIGIARALYRRPTVLVFDEATSALDGMTEEAVMEAIRSLSGDRTVVLIAHRLTTLEACDRVVLLDRGRVTAIGALAELRATSSAFAQFVTRS